MFIMLGKKTFLNGNNLYQRPEKWYIQILETFKPQDRSTATPQHRGIGGAGELRKPVQAQDARGHWRVPQ